MRTSIISHTSSTCSPSKVKTSYIVDRIIILENILVIDHLEVLAYIRRHLPSRLQLPLNNHAVIVTLIRCYIIQRIIIETLAIFFHINLLRKNDITLCLDVIRLDSKGNNIFSTQTIYIHIAIFCIDSIVYTNLDIRSLSITLIQQNLEIKTCNVISPNITHQTIIVKNNNLTTCILLFCRHFHLIRISVTTIVVPESL